MGDGLGPAELLDARELPLAFGRADSGATEVVADDPLRDAEEACRL
jgi:hypothetical protein